MKVAVTAVGESVDVQVDPRFGRAGWFVVVETETMAFEAIENGNGAAAGGAGVSAAKVVIDAGVAAVLTGNCGPNAERTLRAANVKLYTGVKGTVAAVVEQLKSGALMEAKGPSVDSHAGMGG
jgi:predicted Fe-Mo cluster-binding NifX family protein